MMKQSHKCIVAAINSEGESDLFFVIIKCSEEQFDNGDHLDAAKQEAENEGYEPKLAYDDVDSAGKAMQPLFEWTSATTIEI